MILTLNFVKSVTFIFETFYQVSIGNVGTYLSTEPKTVCKLDFRSNAMNGGDNPEM